VRDIIHVASFCKEGATCSPYSGYISKSLVKLLNLQDEFL
jgi:hypothetical protein